MPIPAISHGDFSCAADTNIGFVSRYGMRLYQGAGGIAPLGDSYFFGVLPITFYNAYIEVCTPDSIGKPTNQCKQTRKQQIDSE
jgi:hypothetical protein